MNDPARSSRPSRSSRSSRPSRPSRSPRTLALAALVFVALALSACSSPVASLLPSPQGPLVTVTARGGECMDGPCGSVIAIDRDGTVRAVEPAGDALGTVPDATLTALDAAIKTTDFAVLRAVPFDGECPVNYDGQEFIYEFGGPGGVERIASCETAIDPSHPVFAAVTAALVAVDVLPAP